MTVRILETRICSEELIIIVDELFGAGKNLSWMQKSDKIQYTVERPSEAPTNFGGLQNGATRGLNSLENGLFGK